MLLDTTVDSLRNLPLNYFETDSRKVLPGNIFVCSQGLSHDSHNFASEAVSRGAIGIIATRPVVSDVPCFVVPAKAMAVSLVSQYYHYPQRQIFNVGVTGTNGKTTVAYSLYQLLNDQGQAAYTGTLGCEFADQKNELVNTTPDTFSLLNLMQNMVRAGVTQHIMEVSSHALDQDRVSCIDYDIIVFTNLGEDHLDYHGSREEYLQSKLRLADRLKPGGIAVINLDDPMAMAIIDRCQSKAQIITFSTKNTGADLYANRIKSSCRGSVFQLNYQGKSYTTRTPLPFVFNIENSLAVLAVLMATGKQPDQATALLQQLQPVPGRGEVISLSNGATAIVDYAHNNDALQSLIQHVRQISTGNIYTVMGVTGDRLADAETIGQQCSELSDHAFFTTDNPMGLNPNVILTAMRHKASHEKVTIEKDRAKAIGRAMATISSTGNSDDVLLVCGKGPETWQYTSVDKQQYHPYEGDKNIIIATARQYGLG